MCGYVVAIIAQHTEEILHIFMLMQRENRNEHAKGRESVGNKNRKNVITFRSFHISFIMQRICINLCLIFALLAFLLELKF